MAAAVLQDLPAPPKNLFKPIIDQQASSRPNAQVQFDPNEHLAYEFPEETIMMKDIGYSENTGISPVAVSQPFRLFTPEAVQVIRDQVLNDNVVNNCGFKSNLAAYQLRGYASKYAPFVYDAWNHPETLSIISKIAGVDLIPSMNYEIGHVNLAVKSAKESQEELAAINRQKQNEAANGGNSLQDEKPIVGWHTDSYPFVCVTMLSDCTNMVGGETALRTADGGVLRIRGPQMGCAVVLQGRYITHQALQALGAQERISMVTSFRPRSPHLPDDTVLTTTRGNSDLSQLYYEFGRYRLENLEERLRVQLKHLRDAQTAGKRTDAKALKAFLAEQENFIKRTNEEIVQYEDVIPGFAPELDIPDVNPAAPSRAVKGRARAKLA